MIVRIPDELFNSWLKKDMGIDLNQFNQLTEINQIEIKDEFEFWVGNSLIVD